LQLQARGAFDYSVLDSTTSTHLQHAASNLSDLGQRTAKNLWKMGHILADAQDRLAASNGTFVQWVKQEAGLSVGMAYRLINVYRRFDISKLETTSFAPSALYLLSEPSTPPAARQEAITRAERGEAISHATASQIVNSYRPDPVREFEKEELLPRLHDAGLPDAPQMLSGKRDEPQPVPEKVRKKAGESVRASILEAIQDLDAGDEEAVGACADELLSIMGQQMGTLSIAARFGETLSKGPRTLSDLTDLAIWACDQCHDKMSRDEILAWRKRSLRVLDALTWCGGLRLFQHTLENGQLVYSLMPESE
jgi:hypothetical protein